jgi:hypothetical protein
MSGSRAVFDDQVLAEPRRHPFRHHARNDVGGSSPWNRNHKPDWPVRVLLSLRLTAVRNEKASRCQNGNDARDHWLLLNTKVHGLQLGRYKRNL